MFTLNKGVPTHGSDPKWKTVCVLSGYHDRTVYDVHCWVVINLLFILFFESVARCSVNLTVRTKILLFPRFGFTFVFIFLWTHRKVNPSYLVFWLLCWTYLLVDSPRSELPTGYTKPRHNVVSLVLMGCSGSFDSPWTKWTWIPILIISNERTPRVRNNSFRTFL